MDLFEWADSQQNYVAFDLEIAKEVEGDDWTAQRPLGISCAGLMKPGSSPTAFHGYPQMTPKQCRQLADYILDHHKAGFQIVTWNGLGFDFTVLAEECQDDNYTQIIKDLALNHIDVAFAMFCQKGFMIGLEAAAKGMGLKGKTEGMKGELAPVMWKQGEAEREKVLEYVKQDALVTANVYEVVLQKGYLQWTASSGLTAYWVLGYEPGRKIFDVVEEDGFLLVRTKLGTKIVPTVKKLLTVKESVKLPEPNTSWMDNPWKREKFYGWTNSQALGF